MPRKRRRQPRTPLSLDAERRAPDLYRERERLFQKIAQLSSGLVVDWILAGASRSSSGVSSLSRFLDPQARSAEVRSCQARIDTIDFQLKQLGVQERRKSTPLTREPTDLQRHFYNNRRLPNQALARKLDEQNLFPRGDRYMSYHVMYRKNKALFRQVKSKSIRAFEHYLRKQRPST